METIQWTNELTCGNSVIDEQHHTLIVTMQSLEEIIHHEEDAGIQAEKFSEVLKHLEAYVLYHFKTEEYLWLENHYKDSQMHIQAHQEFSDYVHHMLDQEYTTIAVQVELLNYLKDWLSHHISEVDRKAFVGDDRHGRDVGA